MSAAAAVVVGVVAKGGGGEEVMVRGQKLKAGEGEGSLGLRLRGLHTAKLLDGEKSGERGVFEEVLSRG